MTKHKFFTLGWAGAAVLAIAPSFLVSPAMAAEDIPVAVAEPAPLLEYSRLNAVYSYQPKVFTECKIYEDKVVVVTSGTMISPKPHVFEIQRTSSFPHADAIKKWISVAARYKSREVAATTDGSIVSFSANVNPNANSTAGSGEESSRIHLLALYDGVAVKENPSFPAKNLVHYIKQNCLGRQ